MKKILVVIAGGDTAWLTRMDAIVSQFSGFEVAGLCTSARETVGVTYSRLPDLLILQEELPGAGGLEVLDVIRKKYSPLVILAGSSARHSSKAEKAGILAYLPAPTDEEDVSAAMVKAGELVKRMAERKNKAGQKEQANVTDSKPAGRGNYYLKRVMIKYNGRITSIPVESINYIQHDGVHVKIYTDTDIKLAAHGFKELCQLLDQARFVKADQTFIINVEKIRNTIPSINGEHMIYSFTTSHIKVNRNYTNHAIAGGV